MADAKFAFYKRNKPAQTAQNWSYLDKINFSFIFVLANNMKKSVHIRHLREIFPLTSNTEDIRERINCLLLESPSIESCFSSPLFLNATTVLLVLSGTALLHVNYKTYPLQPDMVLLLSPSHLFHFQECSQDFQCFCVCVSKEFMEDMDSTDMIYRRIKYGVRLYNCPVVLLQHSQTLLLSERITAIHHAIDHSEHLYYKETVLNRLFALYLDLSDAIDRQATFQEESNPTRTESLIKSFIELLSVHYRQQHKVEFYASRLHISAHYLTLIVKRVTGQSVCDFIFEMLYSDARTLLSQSRLSLQEIAALLNFSDQSAFGKFFKRKAGLSPSEFRKKS